MIKMLVIDLDGTLLRSDKTISPYSEEALKKASAAGIKVVFATARPVRAVKHLLKNIPCDAVICHNGAVTFSEGKRTGSYYGVPIKNAIHILKSLKEKYPNKKLSVEINDKIYANFDVTLIWGSSEKEKEMLRASSVLTDFSGLPDTDADKLLIEVDSANEYKEILKLLPTDLYSQLSDGGKLCLVMNKNATKLNAVKQLIKMWDISISDTAAFGDDYNDIELLRNCGVGVAMKNAIPEVLQAADEVTESNDDEGVAKYIMKHIL
jgi:Cof subfamily protein (haloacid dehalogenase superfamily)